MTKLTEDDLDSIYQNLVHLIYKGCVWKGHNHVDCGGELKVVNIISKKNKYFRWDLNNGILLCEAHAKWWSDNRLEPYELLHRTLPSVANFHLINQDKEFGFEPNIEDLGAFLTEHANFELRRGAAPFRSLYGDIESKYV